MGRGLGEVGGARLERPGNALIQAVFCNPRIEGLPRDPRLPLDFNAWDLALLDQFVGFGPAKRDQS